MYGYFKRQNTEIAHEMLRAVLNKSCKRHQTKQQLYDYLFPILQTIQDTRYRQEDLPRVMADRDGWWSRIKGIRVISAPWRRWRWKLVLLTSHLHMTQTVNKHTHTHTYISLSLSLSHTHARAHMSVLSVRLYEDDDSVMAKKWKLKERNWISFDSSTK